MPRNKSGPEIGLDEFAEIRDNACSYLRSRGSAASPVPLPARHEVGCHLISEPERTRRWRTDHERPTPARVGHGHGIVGLKSAMRTTRKLVSGRSARATAGHSFDRGGIESRVLELDGLRGSRASRSSPTTFDRWRSHAAGRRSTSFLYSRDI